MWLSGLFAALVVVALLNLSVAAYAEEIIYTGDEKNLQTGPGWHHRGYYNCFFPGTKETPLFSGNKAIVNYDPATAGAVSPQFVFGGLSESKNIVGNSVVLLNGYINYHVYGGFSLDGNVTNNDVNISGGTVGNCVYGGVSVNGKATGNTVTISGGVVEHSVYGGYSYFGDSAPNTVTIKGKPNLAQAYVYGGLTEIGPGDSFTGNTLKLESSGISISWVAMFENYIFYLPQDIAENAVMLRVAKMADLKGTTIEVALQGDAKLKKGDKIALINSVGGIGNAPKNKSCQVKQGGKLYEFSIYTDSSNLWAQVTKVSKPAK